MSLLTSILSFGLPLLTKCTPCPDPEKYPDIICPRPEGTYGNYVNVSYIVPWVSAPCTLIDIDANSAFLVYCYYL